LKPNCYECKHRRELMFHCHSYCGNRNAHVVGSDKGKRMGWFNWPIDFDPVWLESCNGFEQKE
jgi:hypothetical protein